MDRNQASTGLGLIPIRQKPNRKDVTASDQEIISVWKDMHGWMEKQQRKWEEELAQLKSEFFSLKTTTPVDGGDGGGQRLRRQSGGDAGPGDRTDIGGGGGGGRGGPEDGGRDQAFRLVLDIGQFEPSEVYVHTQGNSLIVRAKHDEKHENKSVSREFNRRVEIPANFDPKTLRCFIREDGKLLVEAELPPERNESARDSGDGLSSTENSFARSYLIDRCSDVRTCGSRRTNPDDTHGQSRLERSRQETGSCLSPRGRVMEGVVLQRSDPNYLEVYPLPKSSSGDFDVVRIESSETPAAERSRYAETEQRSDLFNNHLGGLEPELSENVQKKTYRNDRLKSSGVIHRHSDSRLEGCRFQHALDGDHRLSSCRRWNDPPTENGSSISTRRFSVAVVVGNDFEPHELTVKAVDGRLIVHAERSDPSADRRNCDDLYREFDLPGDVEPETITANLTPEGILILEAPKTDCNCVSQRPYVSNDLFFYDS